jgi:hypothetical protein
MDVAHEMFRTLYFNILECKFLIFAYRGTVQKQTDCLVVFLVRSLSCSFFIFNTLHINISMYAKADGKMP